MRDSTLPRTKKQGWLVCRWMPTVLRLGRGMVRYPGAAADAPAKPLRLWSYESNQFARLVRTQKLAASAAL